jgi:hypothetical protein
MNKVAAFKRQNRWRKHFDGAAPQFEFEFLIVICRRVCRKTAGAGLECDEIMYYKAT